MKKGNEIMVSVAMITYMHEHILEEAINSVLMQECDFEVELIIADDCSPDNTEAIVKQIIRSHPNGHWIKYTRHRNNTGVAANFAWSMLAGKGKYIAICEGDDYWIDSKKLQNQVDFLERNSNYSMTCHATNEVDESGKVFKVANREEEVIDLATVFKEGWFIRTASMVFRKSCIERGFPDFFYSAYSTDYILQILILMHGDCYYMAGIMSAYRRHPGGVTNSSNEIRLKRLLQKVKLLDRLDEYTKLEYSVEIKSQKSNIGRAISWNLLKYPKLLSTISLKELVKYLFSFDTLRMLSKRI
ncbi:MAG: glycosyltransferase [Vicingaceae bacterium]